MNNGLLHRTFLLLRSFFQNGWLAGLGRGGRRTLAALPLLIAASALSAPDGGQVVSGTGSISQSATTTTVNQSSQNLALTWQSFNVAEHEIINFEQPSASAVAVNRILDTNGSEIMGSLNANGQVFLINPNGVLFGQGAQVNVGGLVASTLDLDEAGGVTKTFNGNGSGRVDNYGEINTAEGGYVALLGNRVSNWGTITAPMGSVALGAASAVTLGFEDNSLLTVQVDESVLNSVADNGGLIRAGGGRVVMSAGAKDLLLASVVNNTGVVEARTVDNREGGIVLMGATVNVEGTLDVSAPDGGSGGSIEITAGQANMADNLEITTAAVSGQAGAWSVEVEGDGLEVNPELVGESVVIGPSELGSNPTDGITNPVDGSVVIHGNGLDSNQEDSITNHEDGSVNMGGDGSGDVTAGIVTTDTAALVSSPVFQPSSPLFLPTTSIQQLGLKPPLVTSAANSNRDAWLIGLSAVASVSETDKSAAADLTINLGAAGSALHIVDGGVSLPENSPSNNQ